MAYACMCIWDKMHSSTPRQDASSLIKPIYCVASPSHRAASTPALASTHPWLLLIDRARSSSPTSSVVIIVDNYLHHQHRNIVTAIPDCGQRQRQQNLLPLLLTMPHNYKQKIRV
jgi:hypothetical protein